MTTPTSTQRRGRPPSGGREEILRATLELLEERGVAKLTTKAVAERAGVSEGSVFYHFTDRAGLLIAAFVQSLGPMHLEVSPEPDLRAALGTISEAVQTFLAPGVVVLVAAQGDAELRERVGEFMRENDYGPHRGVESIGAQIAARQREGQVRADVDPRVIARMILSDAFFRALAPRLVGHDRGPVERAAFLDTLVTMLTPA